MDTTFERRKAHVKSIFLPMVVLPNQHEGKDVAQAECNSFTRQKSHRLETEVAIVADSEEEKSQKGNQNVKPPNLYEISPDI